MTEKLDPEEWLAKASYEGGVIEAIRYGLSHKDIDKNLHPEFHAYVKKIVKGWEKIRDRVESLEDEMEES